MALIPMLAREESVNYANLRALVVDDYPGMRSAHEKQNL
jgi:hypothetical protein